MNKKKRRKLRVPFRRNRQRRARSKKLGPEVLDEELVDDRLLPGERMTGKGDLARYRTVIVADEESARPVLDVDEEHCCRGRVVAAAGLLFLVETEKGRRYECTVREVLRKLTREARNAVVAGDRVVFQPTDEEHGVIERVEPRSSTVSRGFQHREHTLVANVDRVVIVASADEPPLKPPLIDRFLISAEKGGIRPIVCINKVDLVNPSTLQPVVGTYARLGYETVLTSVISRRGAGGGPSGILRLQSLLKGHETVFAGQTGVGKSSLLNALQPGWNLRTGRISSWSKKGKHTTSRAILLPLDSGGWVVDTPGIRQFELWDVAPEEVEAYFIEFRPFVASCRFADCTHTHEAGCGVKAAVAQGLIAPARYRSYLSIFHGDD